MYVTDSTSRGIRVYATNSVVWVSAKHGEVYVKFVFMSNFDLLF